MIHSEPSTPDSPSGSTIFVVEDHHRDNKPLVHRSESDFEMTYRCVRCCHVWVCTLLVGVVELILLVLNFVFTISTYGANINSKESRFSIISIFMFVQSERSLVLGILMMLSGFIVIGLLIHGVLKQKPNFILPHLFLQLILILTSIVIEILLIFASVALSRRNPDTIKLTVIEQMINHELSYRQCIGIIIFLACLIFLQGYFVVTVVRCYLYLKDTQKKMKEWSYMPLVPVKRGVPDG